MGWILASLLALFPLTTNLEVDGEKAQQQGVAIVLYVSRSDCTFCRRLEKDVLAPLVKAGALNAVMFRQLSLDGAAEVRGFDGKVLAPMSLAVHYNAEITPTILFLDAQGRELLPRISGYTKNDYYSFYLERAVGKAQRLVVKQAL